MTEWWRNAVIYQVYLPSFADCDGDGVGDLPGHHVAAALPGRPRRGRGLADTVLPAPRWPTAATTSPTTATSTPCFGTLHGLRRAGRPSARPGPARSSSTSCRTTPPISTRGSAPPWRRVRAVPSARGSTSGRSTRRSPSPPNDWPSVFGGPAWTRAHRTDGTLGQWYLHLFDAEQPDLNWDQPGGRGTSSMPILRFWLDRGVDGFRVDVAHGLVKDAGLPASARLRAAVPTRTTSTRRWSRRCGDQHGVHEHLPRLATGPRRLRRRPTTGRPRSWVGNAAASGRRYVRPDEMHQAFNFACLFAPLGRRRPCVRGRRLPGRVRSRRRADDLGAVQPRRRAPRLALRRRPARPRPRSGRGAAHARPARGPPTCTRVEELGLPEVTDLPDDSLQDPTWERSGHTVRGRDGCRVPIPWSDDAPPYGFGPDGHDRGSRSPTRGPDCRCREQDGVPGSTLTFYREALRLRREIPRHEPFAWVEGLPADVLGFQRGPFLCLLNLGGLPVEIPPGSPRRSRLAAR